MKRNRISALIAVATLAFQPPLAAATDGTEDEDGRIIQEIDADGSTVDVRYDDEGRVIEIRAADGSVTRYWYDEEGRQHEVGELE